jgi:hypothetical protein
MVITKCCEDGAARFMGSNVTVPAVLDGGGTNEKVGHHDTLRGRRNAGNSCSAVGAVTNRINT